MKLSSCASLLLGLSLLAPSALADSEYLKKPVPGSVFCVGSRVDFVVERMSDDDDKVTVARLYRHSDAPPTGMKRSIMAKREDDDDDDDDEEDDDNDDDKESDDSGDSSDSEKSRLTFVGTIEKWYGAKVPDDDTPVKFSWVAQNVIPGRYHIQMEEKEVKDVDKVDNGDSDDDVTRSHVFTILPGNSNTCPTNRIVSETTTSTSTTTTNNAYPNPGTKEIASASPPIQQVSGSEAGPAEGGQVATDGQTGGSSATVAPVPEASSPYPVTPPAPAVLQPPVAAPASDPQQSASNVQQVSTTEHSPQTPTVAQNVLASVPLPVANKQIVKRRARKEAIRARQ